jgi:ABC-type cobalamin/Fe3+-siderophores transport system ATPase subunit
MVRVKNLSAGYGKEIVLKNVSFEVPDGKLYGLIGPNGSGKSTLIRSFFKISDVKSGEIFVDNVDILKLRIDEVSSLISVQRPMKTENIQLSVSTYITAGVLEIDKDKLSEILEEFQLTELVKKNISELSDGQFQRVSLAQAVVRNPKVYLLDEPTSHLDLRFKIQLLSGIKKRLLNNSCGIAIVHDLNLAKQFCDRVILLKDGEVIKIDDVQILDNEEVIAELFGLETEY